MIEIKEIQKEQLPIVKQIVYKTWPDAYGEILKPAQIKYMLELFYNLPYLEKSMEQGHRYFVCFENEIPLGFIGIQALDGVLKLHKLYVLPEAQGKKIGVLLFQKAEAVTAEQGLNRLILNVNRFNKAIDFYKRMGMNIFKEEDIHIGHGYLMEDYVMEKKIS